MSRTNAPARQPKILALEPLWLLLLAPFLLLPGRFVSFHWQPWLVAALFLFWPLRWWLQGAVTPLTPVRLAALLFLLTVPLPILVSTDSSRSWEVAGYLLFGVVLANALVNTPHLQNAPQHVAWGLMLCALGLALLGPLIIVPSALSSPVTDSLQSLAAPLLSTLGETINPNILANALLAILPFSLILVLRGGWTNHHWLRWLMLALSLLIGGVIFFTESRGALVASGMILSLLLVLRFPRTFWLVLVAGAAGVVYVAMNGAGVLDNLTQASSGSATSGIAERIELWERGVYAVEDFPLTGVGLGTYSTVVPLLYPFLIIPPNTYIPDAHNLLIQVGVDLGIPGLIAWLGMVFALFAMMAQLLRADPGGHRNPLRWALAAGVTASYVGMLVAGIFAATNWGVKPAFLPWVIGALGVLIHWQHVAEIRTALIVGSENAPDSPEAQP